MNFGPQFDGVYMKFDGIKGKHFILSGVFLFLSLLMLFCKTDFIVNFGIRVFRFCMYISVIGFIASLPIPVYHLIKSVKQEKKSSVPVIKEESVPTLDVGAKLNPLVLQNLLVTMRDSASDKNLYTAFDSVYYTMTAMDSYQARLKELLDNNGADTLRDTEDILDHAEQHICRNVRRFINSVTILDLSNPDDALSASNLAIECVSEDRKLLELTKNFLSSLVELLNRQDTGSCVNEIKMYREAIDEQLALSK